METPPPALRPSPRPRPPAALARDNALPMDRRIEIVEAKAAELIGLGASVER